MKKYTSFKVLQLAILAILTILSLFLLLKPEVKQFVFSSRPATILFFVVWVLLLVSFIFLLIDFNLISTIKLNYHNLYGVAYSDPISGMPNRFSCDTVIEKYYDEKLPEKHILNKDAKTRLMQAIQSLPPQYSQAIIMRYYNNMSIEDIAVAMDYSRSTVKRRLRKGRKLLENMLHEEKGGICFE